MEKYLSQKKKKKILNEEVKYFKQMFSCQVPPTSLDVEFCDIILPKNNVKLSATTKKYYEGVITQGIL